MIHRIAAITAACALLLVAAAPAMAGGWARIVADAPADEPPREGQPIDIGFTVLQHGQTPAPWETPTVRLTDLATGSTVEVVAVNDRADGHFTATVTVPAAGYWTLDVALQDLITEHERQLLTVRTPTGDLPGLDPVSVIAALGRAESQSSDRLVAAVESRIERLDAAIAAHEARIAELQRRGSPGAAGGLPPIAAVTLALLAGAVAGFAAAWLATRPRASVALSPAPREADPA